MDLARNRSKSSQYDTVIPAHNPSVAFQTATKKKKKASHSHSHTNRYYSTPNSEFQRFGERENGGVDPKLLRKLKFILQPRRVQLRRSQAIHRSPTHSSRSLLSSLCSFIFLRFCFLCYSFYIIYYIFCVTDSASSTFIQSLNRRVSIATDDLNLLDSMTFGTVSFEELLGHCNEVYKKNQSDLAELELRLKDFGYNPGTISIQFTLNSCLIFSF